MTSTSMSPTPLEGRPQHCRGGEWDRHRKVGMGEVISLLAAFLTDIGNRRAVPGQRS
jgi:hypothetical protein